MKEMKKRLVLVPASFIFCAFLLLPLLFMVLCSLHSDLTNQWTLANYSDIFSNKYYTQAFVNSVLIAVSSSVIGLIGTFILCLCLMNLSTKLQEKITFVSNLAANFAGIPLAFSFIILLGNVGVLKMILPFLADFNLYSWWGLTITVYLFPNSVRGLVFVSQHEGSEKGMAGVRTIAGRFISVCLVQGGFAFFATIDCQHLCHLIC